jgi:hypothetical protein
MISRLSASVSLIAISFVMAPFVFGATPGASKVEGLFVVARTDAQLKYVRAARVKLDDKGKPGYAVLISARPATGNISTWQTADPKERGSFIFVLFEPNGAIWVAELGHAQAKGGRFGVVTEIQKVAFEVRDQRLAAHIRTAGEQTFSDNRYSVDLRLEAALEGQ